MTFLDVLLGLPMIFFIFKGWKRGIIGELTTLAGIILGCYAATHFSTFVAGLLNLESDSSILVAFFITFMIAVVLAYLLGKLVERLVENAKLGIVNKLVGGLLGFCKCLCLLSVLINFVLMIDPGERIITPTAKEQSVLFKPTHNVGQLLTKHVEDEIKTIRAKHQEKKVQKAQEQESQSASKATEQPKQDKQKSATKTQSAKQKSTAKKSGNKSNR